MPGSTEKAWPGSKRLGVAPDDVGVLVLLQADAVAGAVDEVLAVAGVGDDVAGHAVDPSSHGVPTDAAATAAAWASCRTAYSATNSSGRVAGEHGAGDVRAVAVHRAAEVADHRLAGTDDPWRRRRGGGWPSWGRCRRWRS